MRTLFVLSLILAICGCCSAGPCDSRESDNAKPPPKCLEHESKWVGTAPPEEFKALEAMTPAQLIKFLENIDREPALRVEALRLLVEGTENQKELIHVLLTSLKSPWQRERKAVLSYLSGLGEPEHIPAIEASAEGMDEHFEYSVKCTINQIKERAKEGDR